MTKKFRQPSGKGFINLRAYLLTISQKIYDLKQEQAFFNSMLEYDLFVVTQATFFRDKNRNFKQTDFKKDKITTCSGSC